MGYWRYFRILAIIYGLAMAAAVVEYYRRPINIIQQPTDYAQVLSQVYPQRPETEFFLGLSEQTGAPLEIQPQWLATEPDKVERALSEWQKKLAGVSQHYERSLASGLKS